MLQLKQSADVRAICTLVGLTEPACPRKGNSLALFLIFILQPKEPAYLASPATLLLLQVSLFYGPSYFFLIGQYLGVV